jgi:co-chaperonin GroES (HSP10)
MQEVAPWVDKIDVTFSQILIGIYKRPEKTKSGIILTDDTRAEDEFQGKVGLVVKVGPMAYRDTDDVQFEGFKVKVGDWVVIRASDGWPLKIGKTLCRMIPDTGVRIVIPEPDLIW